ncbi:hypothetical protein L1887_63368 [Cichorium endivia]|nr:hypothetical protein L1887_63368 [Cichorium endivia]
MSEQGDARCQSQGPERTALAGRLVSCHESLQLWLKLKKIKRENADAEEDDKGGGGTGSRTRSAHSRESCVMKMGWMKRADAEVKVERPAEPGGRNRDRPQQSAAERSRAQQSAAEHSRAQQPWPRGERACLQLRVRAPLRPPPNGSGRGERKLRGSSSVAACCLLPSLLAAARGAAASCKELGAPNTPTLFLPFPAHPPSLSRDALTTETPLLGCPLARLCKNRPSKGPSFQTYANPDSTLDVHSLAQASTRLSPRARQARKRQGENPDPAPLPPPCRCQLSQGELEVRPLPPDPGHALLAFRYAAPPLWPRSDPISSRIRSASSVDWCLFRIGL